MTNGGTLQRKVEDAERAAGEVITGQRSRVEGAVPVRLPTEAGRLDSSSRAASESVRQLLAGSGRIRRFLQERSSQERSFERAASGHERPGTIFTDAADARTHSESILDESREAITKQAQEGTPPPALPARVRTDEEIAELQGQIEGYSQTISTDWFTNDFLGEAVFARYSETPPIVTGEDESWFHAQVMAFGSSRVGYYYPDTNHITIGAYQAERGETEALHIIAHEQLHYAAFLGGGMDIRWRDESDAPNFRDRASWNIHEGLTELLAQHLCRDNGYQPAGVSYPYESGVCFGIEQVVGRDLLRAAYFSGDFTEVRRTFDSSLGAGSFDALMGKRSAADAFSYLMERVSAAGMDYAAWESNPIMAQCYRQIATERFW